MQPFISKIVNDRVIGLTNIRDEKVLKCELCDREITEENRSDNSKRCSECYEEWADCWPDRI